MMFWAWGIPFGFLIGLIIVCVVKAINYISDLWWKYYWWRNYPNTTEFEFEHGVDLNKLPSVLKAN